MNWARGASLEAARTFAVARVVCPAGGSQACSLFSYHFKEDGKVNVFVL